MDQGIHGPGGPVRFEGVRSHKRRQIRQVSNPMCEGEDCWELSHILFERDRLLVNKQPVTPLV